MSASGTGTLLFVETVSIAILAFFLYRMPRDKSSLGDIALIAAASWVGEVSCIQLYRFYQYDAPWTLFIGPMPFLVALIWPFVILSARELAAGSGRRSAAVFAIVLYDACLVEPVAVRAALWSWNEPGLFGVPPIGILGWAYFAVSTSWLLDRVHGASRLAILVLAPLATHAMLLATWWGALRWIGRGEIPASAAAASAFGIAVVLAIFVRRSGKSAPLSVMAPRMAAAALFFTLLFWRGSDLLPLVVYGSSFAIPYLAATQWAVET